MTTQRVRSPLPWLGGKYYSAPLIVEAFPSPRRYEVYVDLFGGAAHVLLQKPFFKGHTEIYNDINSDLVNFWMQCRDHAEELEARCRSLPYSRDVYYQYHASLCDRQQELEPLERAARWFYVLRSSFSRWEQASSPSGWNASRLKNEAHAYRSALDLFTLLQVRLQDVIIDHRDFEQVFCAYDRPRTLFYIDPPYIGAEGYYRHPFTLADHERLAALLNASSALIALSYAPHPLLETLYPTTTWRRLTWEVRKHSQRSKGQREKATELLLCNYPELTAAPSLWTAGEEVVSARTPRRF